MRRTALVIAPLVTAGLLLSGCSESKETEQKTENANAGVCLGLAEMEETISMLRSEAASAAAEGKEVTVEQAQEAVNQIDTAYNDIQSQVAKLNTAMDEQFAEAEQQYQTAIANLEPGESLADAGKQVEQAQTNFVAAYDEMVSTLGCE